MEGQQEARIMINVIALVAVFARGIGAGAASLLILRSFFSGFSRTGIVLALVLSLVLVLLMDLVSITFAFLGEAWLDWRFWVRNGEIWLFEIVVGTLIAWILFRRLDAVRVGNAAAPGKELEKH